MICTECGGTVVASYIKAHMMLIYGIRPPQTMGVNEVGVGPTTCLVSFPRVLQEVKCMVPGCP